MMSELTINCVIEWLSETSEEELLERVLWIGLAERQVITFDLQNKNALPVVKQLDEVLEAIEDRIARVVEYLPDPILLKKDDEISDYDKQIRDKWWNVIKDIVSNEPDIYYKNSRGILINRVLQNHNTIKKSIYKQLRKYWESGKSKNSLIPAYYKCGGKGKEKSVGDKKRGRPRNNIDINGEGINVTKEIKEKIIQGAKRYYSNSNQLSIQEAYERTLGRFFKVGYRVENGVRIPILPEPDKLITIEQFKYWMQEERYTQKSQEKRFGKNDFQLNKRPVLGESTSEAIGPGSIYQIDATITDVYIVNSLNRDWTIKRPILYVVIDVFSRMIVGIYVGLEGPSWIGAMMALANVATDKVEFCKRYDIDINQEQWPCKSLPETLIADRGELEGEKPENLINSLNMTLQNTAPYRADLKGIVEKNFDLLDKLSTSTLPGKVKKGGKKRGDKDYRLDATLTLNEFTKIIINCVLYHNNSKRLDSYDRDEFMIQQDVEPIPIKLWQWGIDNRAGSLRTINEDIVKLNLMPTGKAKITGRGIKFGDKYTYSCKLAQQENWFGKARLGVSRSVDVSYDPRNMENIYIRLDNGMKFEKCYLLTSKSKFKDYHMEEIENLIENERRQKDEHKHKQLQAKVNLHAQNDSITEKAKEEKQKDKQIYNMESTTKKLNSINQRNREEKENQRQKESFELGVEEKHKKTSKQEQLYIAPTNHIANRKRNRG